MRLFCAVNFGATTVSNLVMLQDELRCRAGRGNYSLRQNLHLTLAFLGEYDGAQAGDAIAAMDAVNFAPFTVVISHVGRNKQHGRELWWAGLDECKPLMTMRQALARELRAKGCDFDQRQFSPHITLAREIVTDVPPWPIEAIAEPVKRFDLMRSERLAGQLTYTSIHACVAGSA